MTTPDPSEERWTAGLLASAADDRPATGSLDRELARLGLATTAVVAIGAGTAGTAAAGGAGALAATKAGAAGVLSMTVVKVALVVAIGAVSVATWVAVKEPTKADVPAVSAQPNLRAPAIAATTGVAAATPTETAPSARAETEPPRTTRPADVPLARTMDARKGPASPSSHVAAPAPPGSEASTNAAPAPSAEAIATAASPERGASLAAEVALVDRARSLAHSRPAEALATLDQHAALFPQGVLRDEAAVVRLEALLAAGRREEGERLAAPFLRDRAGTPIARRMRALLGESIP